MKLIFFKFIYLLVIIDQTQSNDQLIIQDQYENKECNLYNDHYRGDYLYSPSNLYQNMQLYREALAWHPFHFGTLATNARKGIFKFNDEDKQGIWRLIKVENLPNTYFIQNVKYGEFLYASMFHVDDIYRQRRHVFTWKDSNLFMDGHPKYMWQLREPYIDPKKTKTDDLVSKKVTIWNMAYKQPLYAASRLYGHGLSRRRLFTYFDKPDENKFNWFIVCKGD
jgi:hypothetical protein